MGFQKSTLKYLIKQGNERLEVLYIHRKLTNPRLYHAKKEKPESKDMVEVTDDEVSKFDSCNKLKIPYLSF